jgi:hypothetical protein
VTLAALPAAAAERIAGLIPELRTCRAFAGRFDLRELKALSTQAPAVFVSVLRGRQGRTYSGPAHTIDLDLAAFVVARDALGAQRDALAAAICQKLMVDIPGRRWGLPACGEAERLAYTSLNTRETNEAAVAFAMVAWVQPVSLAPEDTSAPQPLSVYLGQASDIGPDHVDDYELIGEASS